MNAEQIRQEIRDIISFEVHANVDGDGYAYQTGYDDAATAIMQFIGPLLKYEDDSALQRWLEDGWLEQDFEEKGALYRHGEKRTNL